MTLRRPGIPHPAGSLRFARSFLPRQETTGFQRRRWLGLRRRRDRCHSPWSTTVRSLRTRGYLVIQNYLRSEEHTSELQSRFDLVCRLLLEKKKNTTNIQTL